MDPTKLTPLMSGCVRNSSASLREQVTRLTTPSGNPASCSSSARRIAVIGVMEAALITMVLPAAMHSGVIQPIGIMPGKLKGTMPAKTPTGSRYRTVS
ncbi:MAG: hypothetical protein BWY37_01861 [Firmicutes bacterium ADurb.Bin262]|nr:MAG: hypothetical protein BWY37_01861 [Firmicutes bacterium ADurb.Bin262]